MKEERKNMYEANMKPEVKIYVKKRKKSKEKIAFICRRAKLILFGLKKEKQVFHVCEIPKEKNKNTEQSFRRNKSLCIECTKCLCE